MPSDYHEIESRIRQALAAYQRDGTQFITHLARDFQVPSERLRMRIRGRKSKSERHPANKKLTAAQENILESRLQQLSEAGELIRPDTLLNVANAILAETHNDPGTAPPTVGKVWSRRYFRLSPYSMRRTQTNPQTNPQAVSSTNIYLSITYDHKITHGKRRSKELS